jgi:hypothetical protein
MVLVLDRENLRQDNGGRTRPTEGQRGTDGIFFALYRDALHQHFRVLRSPRSKSRGARIIGSSCRMQPTGGAEIQLIGASLRSTVAKVL